MELFKILIVILLKSSTFSLAVSDFHTETIDATLDQIYQKQANSNLEFIFHYRDLEDTGLRVHSSSNENDKDHPLLVVVKQEKGILSWQIPFFIKREDARRYDRYNSVNRTLCPIENHPEKLLGSVQTDVYITVSTSSTKNVSFTIRLYKQEIFQITDFNQSVSAMASPSAPIFFQVNLKEEEAALVKFESKDGICAILSVQNVTCPVFDLDRNVKFEGLYQTVDNLTGITYTQDQYPVGIYLVVVVKTDDTSCHKSKEIGMEKSSSNFVDSRMKTFTLSISKKISYNEYLLATFGAFGIFVGFYILVLLISCVFCIKDYRLGLIEEPLITNEESNVEESPDNTDGIQVLDEEIVGDQANITTTEAPNLELEIRSESTSSLDETDIDFLEDADKDKDVFRTKTFMYVSDLARKSPRVHAKKSSLYHWNLITIAIFYGLPVVQLVLTYQNVNTTGKNQDLCYFNFLCTHPLGMVTDFNHVFSNLGYVMLGILFILIVRGKDHKYQKLSLEHRKNIGIPQHFGMYYAMGIALIMEGIMSGCYHVCPNHTNFQFDTAFMYTISILILLKIYQTRHPDINANAYTAFGVLAFIIFIGVIGVLHSDFYFWMFFTSLHCISCLVLSFQIYYMGRWKVNAGIFKRIWLVCVNDIKALISGQWRALKPLYIDRFILLCVLNIANWSLSGFGAGVLSYQHYDFATFLLAIFILNVWIYTIFYMIMKLRYKERIGAQPATYLLISLFTWTASAYFFFNKSASSNLPPAESRHLNKDCVLFHFYDNHDIWHFLSATSLFLSFMILLTWDDDLENTPRNKIPVF